MNAKPTCLFVYGSLRKNSNHPKAALLCRAAEFIAEGYLQGQLYDIGHYPGAVLSQNRDDRVQGDIYALHDASALLPVLDDYEECTPNYAEPHEYRRVIVEVVTQHGDTMPVWTYLYMLPVATLPRVLCGDYLQYLRERDADLADGFRIGRPY